MASMKQRKAERNRDQRQRHQERQQREEYRRRSERHDELPVREEEGRYRP